MAVSFGLSAGITSACSVMKDKDGNKMKWGCFGLGVLTTIIAGAAFEMAQEDYTDYGRDMRSNAIGAVTGSLLSIAIVF